MPTPPTAFDLHWRPVTLADVGPVHELLLAIDAHDNRHWAGVLSDLENEFRDPEMDLALDTLAGFTPDGQVVAMNWVFNPPHAENERRSFLYPDLHPDFRTPAMEDFMMAWCEARGRQALAAHDDGLPKLLRGSARSHDQRRMDWYERHGFQKIRYFYEMRRDLAQPIEAPELLDGMRLVPWAPEYDEGAFQAFNASFRDHWGFETLTKESWNLYFTGRAGFRPDLTFLILAGAEVVGFSINFLNPEENERKGVQEAWIGDLGVVRAWRKRGLATTLLNQSMQAFKAAGMAYATLGVDSENPTGALGIYERVGFVPVHSSVAFGKYI